MVKMMFRSGCYRGARYLSLLLLTRCIDVRVLFHAEEAKATY